MKALHVPKPPQAEHLLARSSRELPGSCCEEFSAAPTAGLRAPGGHSSASGLVPANTAGQRAALWAGRSPQPPQAGGTPYLFAPAWQRRQVLHPPAVHRHSRLLTGGTGWAWGTEANEVGVMVLLNEPPERHAGGRVLRAALLNAAAWLRKQTPSPLRDQKVRGRKGSHVTCGLGARYTNPFQQLTRALGMCCARRRVEN